MEDSNTERKINVDIGGGSKAEFFLELSKKNPRQTFLVLDPAIELTPNCPKNLHLVKWQSGGKDGASSRIPLKGNSVDKAYLSFLMGELYRGEERITDATALENYSALVVDLRQVIKTEGSVLVTEPRANIKKAREIFSNAGFKVSECYPITDHQLFRTTWTKKFYYFAVDDYEQGNVFHDPRLSSLWPMSFVAEN